MGKEAQLWGVRPHLLMRGGEGSAGKGRLLRRAKREESASARKAEFLH